MHILANAGHQLHMGNPVGFVELLKKDLLNEITHEYNLKQYTVSYVDDNDEPLHLDTEYERWKNGENTREIPINSNLILSTANQQATSSLD